MPESDLAAESKPSFFHNLTHSIRTRFSVTTAVFLLTLLGVFYVGGRIVLVHFVREAENQVRSIATDINQFVSRHSAQTRRLVAEAAEKSHPRTEQYLSPHVSFAARYTALGEFEAGSMQGDESDIALQPDDLSLYSNFITAGVRVLTSKSANTPVGFLRIRNRTFQCALARLPDNSVLLAGVPFNPAEFANSVNSSFSGFNVRISSKAPTVRKARSQQYKFQIGDLVTHAFTYYTGGFWELGSAPFEAFYTLRDAAGIPISSIMVSMPHSFSGISSNALARLTIFITAVGMILIIPILWFQGHVILNPLAKMIAQIRQMTTRRNDSDCPRLEWSGRDEFAQLAASVNVLLESIVQRSAAIAQSESHQRALISCFPDGLAVFDAEGRLVSILKQPENVPPVPGFTPGQIPSAEIYGDAASEFANHVKSISASGEVTKLSMSVKNSASNPRRFEFRFTLMDERHVLVTVRDITKEARELDLRRRDDLRKEQLRKQESLTVFAAGIAHDVNNVLALINNTAEIMWLEMPEEYSSEGISTIREAVCRGTSMMRELMTYAGETRTALSPSNPADLLRGAERLIRGIVPQSVTLSFSAPDNLPLVDADPDRLWKVFFNLAKNASEAIGSRPGSLSFSVESYSSPSTLPSEFFSPRPPEPAPGVLFTISDTGPGIPDTLFRTLFDPYVSTKASGRGLGLAISHAIVESHNACISVSSRFNQGTTFRIYMPLSKTAAKPQPAAAKPAAKPDGSFSLKGREIMLVDDDPSIINTTSILLKTLGAVPLAASGRHDALALMRHVSPALCCLVIDAHLDSGSSIHLLRAFRTVAPNIPAIVVSGSTEEEIKPLFATQPYDDFLPKPYTILELKSAIAKSQSRYLPK